MSYIEIEPAEAECSIAHTKRREYYKTYKPTSASWVRVLSLAKIYGKFVGIVGGTSVKALSFWVEDSLLEGRD